MIAAFFLFLAYILPIPIAGACFYYHVFAGVHPAATRLVYIGILSVAPSILLMIFALKRIIHSVFHVIGYAVIFYALYHLGIIGHAHAPVHVK